MASWVIASQSARVSTPPVGLAGVLSTSTRVRGVTSERSSSTSIRKSLASRMGTDTGVAPTKFTSERVDGIAGVRHQHLVARLDHGEEQEVKDVLAAGDEHHLFRSGLHTGVPGHVAGGRLAHLPDAAGRGVVGGTFADGADGGLGDVVGGREVGLADLQMDDVPTLGLEPPGAGQHLEGGLGAEAGHPLGEAQRAHAVTVIEGMSPRKGCSTTSTASTLAERGPCRRN